jgi:hypothetical protein
MKTYRILPATLAVAVIAACGASQAIASDFSAPKGEMTMSQAEQRAIDVVGGGKIIETEQYGIHHDLYKFDIAKGTSGEQVYVNGETGSVMAANTLNPNVDPTLIAGPILNQDHPKS